jgi:hypothetical protein
MWQWLARRSGRIAGLSLELRLEVHSDDATETPHWVQPLQTLSGIPGVQLDVTWDGSIVNLDQPCVALWLKQHGHLISHLTVEVDISEDRLKLRQFSEAAAPCKSIDLTLRHDHQVVDLADIDPVAGALHHLSCHSGHYQHGSLMDASAFKNMTQLVALCLDFENFRGEEPFVSLASATSLQQLHLTVGAIGDPSPLSALTGLSFLKISSFRVEEDDEAPFNFSSLQALSTLQQLEVLDLGADAFAATSLQGLAGLSNLKNLTITPYGGAGSKLRSLEGISSSLTKLFIGDAPDLTSLVGIEGCTSLEELSLCNSNIHSLQPLRGLSSLKHVVLFEGSLTSLEGLNGMSLQSLNLRDCRSLTHLSGMEHLSALTSLLVVQCGVTSLQPLSQLGEGLHMLRVSYCKGVQEEVSQLPHVQPTADVVVRHSNVKEVVLAGGLWRAV